MGKLYDRVKMSTATTGTGTITLGSPERSASVGDFVSFAEAGIPDGTLVTYFIQDGNNWAEGEGTYTTAGTTLSRDTNEIRWNGTAISTNKLTLSGTAVVYISPRAVDVVTPSEVQTLTNKTLTTPVITTPAIRQALNAQTGTTYTFVLADEGKMATFSNASAITVTVPANSSVAFPVGTQIDNVQLGAGQVTFTPAGGVTIRNTPGLKLRAQYSSATLRKIATDEWLIAGDLAA